MVQIEIDEELYGFIEREARFDEGTPNEVLRRLVMGEGPDVKKPVTGRVLTKHPTGRALTKKRLPGGLIKLVRQEVIQPGDQLAHTRKRSGETFTATVDEHGWVVLPEGERYQAPSPALRACVGSEVDGWAYWTHVRSGKTLRQLRQDLAE